MMSDDGLAAWREAMVSQVRTTARTISESVLDALRAVPRHLFLPGVPPETAYQDDAIVTRWDSEGYPISSSSQPTIMALMLDQLGPEPGHRVLEIGAGTGYNAALISHLVGPSGRVVSLDLDADVVAGARANLDSAGYPQPTVVCADGAKGHPAAAPYDRIIATVGVWDLFPAWLEQLAAGGRLVVPLDLGVIQRSVAFESAGGHWPSLSVVPCGFMRLRGESAGPDRTYLLDPDTHLSLSLPDGGEPDRQAILAALTGPAVQQPTDIVDEPRDLLLGFGLWLAIHEPRRCTLSETTTTRTSRLPSAPVQMRDFRITAGIVTGDSIAVLTSDRGAPPAIAVAGHGPHGATLASSLAAHVRAWDADGRPGSGEVRVDAYPRSTPDADLAGQVIMDKRYTRLALSWSKKQGRSGHD